MKRLLSMLAVSVVLAAACTAGEEEGPATGTPAGSPEPVTITIWGQWSGRELTQFNQIFDGFTETYPWITVKSVGSKDDPAVIAAIRAGNPPDAVLSFSLDSVGEFCSSGAWVDLMPYIERDNLDLSQFPASVFDYTSFAGSQCAFPFLTDAYGLYYNTEMFDAAGLTEPPRTMSELLDYAKKLTVFNPDGSIEVAGFVPWAGFYSGNAPSPWSVIFDADWYGETGDRSAVATDPDWQEFLTWQKELVDFYGADNLQRFVAEAGGEWGGGHAFHHEKIAMMMDGEWRTAFIADLAPDLQYATAPFPVPDDRVESYGVGQIGGTIIGIPRGSPHPEEAWLLVSWMATDTDTLVYMANNVRNVPTTFAALESPDLDAPPEFQTFLEIFSHPESRFKETSAIGVADQDLVSAFWEKWQAGEVTDLEAGLEQVSGQIDDLLAQAGV